MAIAAQGQKIRPVLVSPNSLKPFLRFQKLPSSALAVVRKAVEDDEIFRGRIASVATEEFVGPLGVLWLTRPAGWEAEATRLAADELATIESHEADRQERTAVKRLEATEQSAARARAELVVAAEELARERDKRQHAEARANEAASRAAAAETALVEVRLVARQERDRASAARAALDAASIARRELQERHDAVVTRLDVALAARVDADVRSAADVARRADDRDEQGRNDQRRDGRAVAAAATALTEAARAMAQVASALDGTARALTADVGPRATESPTATPVQRDTRRARQRRTPVPIPGGLYGDMPEVAAYLLRVPNIVVVVDGYNVAMAGWPELDLADQRERLLDMLEDLVRRCGPVVHVVFDGADVTAPPSGRRLLRVRFSPPGIIADDVIRTFVEELPATQSVVVVTSDNAILASVRAKGANTVSSAQFLSAVRR